MKNMIILMMMVINENEVVIGMIMVGMMSPNKIKVMVASLIIIWILVICIYVET